MACIGDATLGKVLATELSGKKRRIHILEEIALAKDNELKAYLGELGEGLLLHPGYRYSDQSLYEDIYGFLRETQFSNDPATAAREYIQSYAVDASLQAGVRTLFIYCWGRQLYERTYCLEAVCEDVDMQGVVSKKIYYAIAKGWNIGIFTSAIDYENGCNGFSDFLTSKLRSKWIAQQWIKRYSWPRGKGVKYYVIKRKKSIRLCTEEEKGELLYVSDDLDETMKWMRNTFAMKKKSSPNPSSSVTELGKALATALQMKLPNEENEMHPATETNSSAFDGAMKKQKKEKKQAPSVNTEENPVVPFLSVSDSEEQETGQNTVEAPSGAAAYSLFRGIQFDKHIFRGMPVEVQQRFRKTFAQRLAKLGRIFRGSRDAGNDFKSVSPNGRRVFKRRIGKGRLSMVYKDGILSLLKYSTHDRQMVDIRNLHGKSIGYVYYDTEDFLRQMEEWTERNKHEKISFGDYMAEPRHFVFDQDQTAIIESAEKAENLSVIGNAGAGKSIVGMKWLGDKLETAAHDVLYLTMSENLVYTLGFEFEKDSSGKQRRSKADIRTTFDFLRECFIKQYPRIPEKNLLNAAQSLALFRRFWAEEVDWTQFWNNKDENFSLENEEATLLSAWREIHGILKGGVPLNVDFKKLGQLQEVLSEEDYRERMRQEKKDSVRDIRWTDALYRTYEKYQSYLKRRQLLDDNDIARMLLLKPPGRSRKYSAAFVDECQDLTQMELLAIFHLLSEVRDKRMSSDRCQMVQPTYFDEGWMRTTADAYDEHLGKALEKRGWKPRYLHYNYRSVRSIIDFQNYAVQYLRYSDILTLKQLETEEIRIPPLTPQGMRPIWIMPGEENRRMLIHGLWKKVDASDLQTIFAFKESVSKSDFPSDGIDVATDILSCKGMEYPAVLLYNVLDETRFRAC